MENYDFLIIGAGCTGLSAAMYAARLGLKTLCLGSANGTEMPIGGVITTTDSVENYPGFINISGAALAKAIRDHAQSYSLVTIREERAVNIISTKDGFIVETDVSRYNSKTILFATGTRWKKLEVPGSRDFENRGVSYCALCDGPLYRGKTVAVIGGSDSAAKEALLLSEHAKKVYIIARGKELRAEPVNLKRISQNPKIEVIKNTNILSVNGAKKVESVSLDNPYGKKDSISLDGIFVAIGHEILSELAVQIGVKVNPKKEIIIDHLTCATNIQGVYAAGDVADTPFKQVITGAAEGCTAAHSAYEHLRR